MKLSIAPVAVLGGEFGVFAEEDISPSSTILGCYAGKRMKEEENEESKYIFQIRNKNGEITEYIDADKIRDWTAYLNHSCTPNIGIKQKKIKGEEQICFYPMLSIKKGEQLFIDYEEDYFINLGFKPFYLHPKDNSYSAITMYTLNRQHYSDVVMSFYKPTGRDISLMQDLYLQADTWLVPKIFFAVKNNDIVVLRTLLAGGVDPDLLAYSIDNAGVIYPPKFQQHLTALMLACYWGHEECINILIENGADINRCTLVSGQTPLMLLLTGYANIELKEKLGEGLLDKMAYPFNSDLRGRTVLHYASAYCLFNLLAKILTIIKVEKVPVAEKNTTTLFALSLTSAFYFEQFHALELMMEFKLKMSINKNENNFITEISNPEEFLFKTFAGGTEEQFRKIKMLLAKPLFQKFVKETQLLEKMQYFRDKYLTKKKVNKNHLQFFNPAERINKNQNTISGLKRKLD